MIHPYPLSTCNGGGLSTTHRSLLLRLVHYNPLRQLLDSSRAMATKEMLPMSLGKSDEPEVGVTGGASSSGKPRNFLFSKVDELFTQPGLVTATEPGFYGEGVPKILSYAGKDVRSILAPFFLSDLTVCNSWQMWANHSVMVMYALTLMLIIGYTCFPDGHMGDQDACKDGYNLNVCQLNETLEDAKDEYRFLVAFILAGYVGMSVNIWYLRRKNYASLCGNVRNTLLNVSSWIQLDKDNDELMEGYTIYCIPYTI